MYHACVKKDDRWHQYIITLHSAQPPAPPLTLASSAVTRRPQIMTLRQQDTENRRIGVTKHINSSLLCHCSPWARGGRQERPKSCMAALRSRAMMSQYQTCDRSSGDHYNIIRISSITQSQYTLHSTHQPVTQYKQWSHTQPLGSPRREIANCRNCKGWNISLRLYPERKFNFSTFYCLKAVRNSISPVDTTTHLQIKKLGLAGGKLSSTHRNKYKSKWTMTTVSGMEALELTVAGRQSKIWTSKLRHIKRKTRTNLHKTKTICQQLI